MLCSEVHYIQQNRPTHITAWRETGVRTFNITVQIIYSFQELKQEQSLGQQVK